MMRLLLAAALCAAATSVVAADVDGAYFSQRPDNCRDFRRLQGADDRTPAVMYMRGWVSGYLTAYNRQTPETYDVLGIADFEAALRFIDGYCKAHLFDDLTVAMEALTEEMYPRRHRTKRQAGR